MSNTQINIVENGTTTLATAGKYCDRNIDVNVSVADPRVKGIIERTITEISDDKATSIANYMFNESTSLITANFPNVTTVEKYGFYKCEKLTTLNLENLESIGEYAFYYCKGLPTADFPKVTSVGGRAFYGCNITAVNLPNVTEASSYGTFSECRSIESVNMPKLTKVGQSMFFRNYKLTSVELTSVISINTEGFSECRILPEINLPSVTSIGGYAFSQCYKLAKIIIGTTNCTLTNANAFKDIGSTGYIYVPDEAVEWYKTATNWSTYADKIKGISELPQE